jgi:hypothetical protein
VVGCAPGPVSGMAAVSESSPQARGARFRLGPSVDPNGSLRGRARKEGRGGGVLTRMEQDDNEEKIGSLNC